MPMLWLRADSPLWKQGTRVQAEDLCWQWQGAVVQHCRVNLLWVTDAFLLCCFPMDPEVQVLYTFLAI